MKSITKKMLLYLFLSISILVNSQSRDGGVFTLSTKVVNATCPSNGKITVSLANLSRGADVIITLNPEGAGDTIIREINNLTGETLAEEFNTLKAGETFHIVVEQTLNGKTTKQEGDVTVEKRVENVKISRVAVTKHGCGGKDAKITVIHSAGLPTLYKVVFLNTSSGAVLNTIIDWQSNPVMILPSENKGYKLRVYAKDDCGGVDSFDFQNEYGQDYSLPTFKYTDSYGECGEYTYNIDITRLNLVDESLWPIKARNDIFVGSEKIASYSVEIDKTTGKSSKTIQIPLDVAIGKRFKRVAYLESSCGALSPKRSEYVGIYSKPRAIVHGVCGGRNGLMRIDAPLSTKVKFIKFPEGFKPSDYSDEFLEGSKVTTLSEKTTIELGSKNKPLPLGDYEVGFEICGTKIKSKKLTVVEKIETAGIPRPVFNCESRSYEMLFTEGPNVQVTSAPQAFIDANGGKLPINFSENKGPFTILEGLLLGEYSFNIETKCGSLFKETLNIEDLRPNPEDVYANVTESFCYSEDRNVVFYSSRHSYADREELKKVRITSAPQAFIDANGGKLPVDVTLAEDKRAAILENVSEGEYTYEILFPCHKDYSGEFTIENRPVKIEPILGCGNFKFWVYGKGGEYFIQHLNEETGLWGSINGKGMPEEYYKEIIEKSKVSYYNEFPYSDGTTKRYVQDGRYRVIRRSISSNIKDGVINQRVKGCFKIIKEFDIELDRIDLKDYNVYGCENEKRILTIDVEGQAPFKYKIVKKNGVEVSYPEQSEPVFTDLDKAEYEIEVYDKCPNKRVFKINTEKLKLPEVKTSFTCYTSIATLHFKGNSNLNVEWFKDGKTTGVTGLTYRDYIGNENNSLYEAKITYSVNGVDTCLDYSIPVNLTKNILGYVDPGEGKDVVYKEEEVREKGLEDLNNLVKLGAIEGKWESLDSKIGIEDGHLVDLKTLELNKVYEFRYTVTGCDGEEKTAIASIKVNPGTKITRWVNEEGNSLKDELEEGDFSDENPDTIEKDGVIYCKKRTKEEYGIRTYIYKRGERAIKLNKTALPSIVNLGDEITYTFTVENVGDLELTNVTLDDPKLGGTIALEKTTLAPGEVTTGTAKYTVTEDDVKAGEVENSAVVKGTGPKGKEVSDTSDSFAPEKGNKNNKPNRPTVVLIQKPCDDGRSSLDFYYGTEYEIGCKPIEVLFTLTPSSGGYNELEGYNEPIPTYNISYSTEDGVIDSSDTVEDDYQGLIEGSIVVSQPGTYKVVAINQDLACSLEQTFVVTQKEGLKVEAGETKKLTCEDKTVTLEGSTEIKDATYLWTTEDGIIDSGETTLKPVVSKAGTYKLTVTSSEDCTVKDTVVVTAENCPGIKLNKTAPSTPVNVGDEITYTFTVENVGDVELTNVTVNDPKLGGAVTLKKTTLAPEEVTTGEAKYTVTKADLDAGKVENTATAVGTDPKGGTVTDTSDSSAPEKGNKDNTPGEPTVVPVVKNKVTRYETTAGVKLQDPTKGKEFTMLADAPEELEKEGVKYYKDSEKDDNDEHVIVYVKEKLTKWVDEEGNPLKDDLKQKDFSDENPDTIVKDGVTYYKKETKNEEGVRTYVYTKEKVTKFVNEDNKTEELAEAEKAKDFVNGEEVLTKDGVKYYKSSTEPTIEGNEKTVYYTKEKLTKWVDEEGNPLKDELKQKDFSDENPDTLEKDGVTYYKKETKNEEGVRTYVYTKEKVTRYETEDGVKLQDPTTGKEFTMLAEAPSELEKDGVTYVKTSEKDENGEHVIVYVKKKEPVQPVAPKVTRYETEDGTKLKDSTTGKSFTMLADAPKELEKDGVTYVKRSEKDENGEHVIVYVKKQEPVQPVAPKVTRYETEDGVKLQDPTTGKEFTMLGEAPSELEKDGVTYVKTSEKDENGEHVIVYVKKKDPVQPVAPKVTRYETEDGTKLKDSTTGKSFTMLADAPSELEKDGVTYVKTSEKEDNGEHVIVYVKKQEPVKITTEWVDEEGNPLKGQEPGKQEAGTLKGYEIVETVTDEKGNLKHIFKQIKTDYQFVNGGQAPIKDVEGEYKTHKKGEELTGTDGNKYVVVEWLDPVKGVKVIKVKPVKTTICGDGSKGKEIVIYNEFSPNGDGINDYLHIDNIDSECYNNKLEIFNRWGNTVWEGRGYNNTTVRFEGISGSGSRAVMSKSDKLPAGTYYYVLDLGDGSKLKKGWIYINR